MNKENRITLATIIRIAITALTVVIGIILVSVLGNIYFDGKEKGGYIYNTESIDARKPFLIIAFILFVILVIASIVMHFLFKEKKTFAKREIDELYHSFKDKKDLSALDEEKAAIYKNNEKTLLIIRIIDIAICVVLAIFPVCYIFNFNNFDAQGNLMEEAAALAIHTLPFFLGMYIFTVVSIYLSNRIQLRTIEMLKTLKMKKPENKNEMKKRLIINILRGVIFIVAVTFIIVGAVNGETQEVLNKAVNICTECIGLG